MMFNLVTTIEKININPNVWLALLKDLISLLESSIIYTTPKIIEIEPNSIFYLT